MLWKIRNILRSTLKTTTTLFLLILTGPIIGCCMICIRLESSGSPIYTQWRSGKGLTLFKIYKLRTIYRENKDSYKLIQENDPRVTRIGRILRAYKIDELPQLINILRGEMCWIGMRPEQPLYSKQIIQKNPSFRRLWNYTPGLISLGVIQCGYATTIKEMEIRAKYDIYYNQHKSFRLSIYILIRTIKIILNGKGR